MGKRGLANDSKRGAMFKNLNPEALGISARDSELIELVLSHGFKGLDLDLVALAEQAQTQGLDKASRLITSARLKIGSFRLPVRWHDDSPDYKADLEQIAGLGRDRGQAGLHADHDHDRSRAATRGPITRISSSIAAAWRKSPPCSAPHKIRLGIDFIAPVHYRAERRFQFMQTFDEVLLLLRSTDSTNVGLALDTWHWHLGGGKLEQLRTLSADRIVTVTLADAPADENAQTARLESRRLGHRGRSDRLAGRAGHVGRDALRRPRHSRAGQESVWRHLARQDGQSRGGVALTRSGRPPA